MDLNEGLRKIEEASFPMSHRELSRVLGGAISHASVSRIAKTLEGLKSWGKEEAAEVWKKFKTEGARQMHEQKMVVRVDLRPDEWEAISEAAQKENLRPYMLVYQLISKYLQENKKLF